MSRVLEKPRKAAVVRRGVTMKISVVIPFFNEEECILQTHERICTFMESIGARYEIICVNDGSTDATMRMLRSLHDKDPRVKVVSFSRNFGHQIAVMAGLRYAKCDCVVVMDADLQDPPEVVKKMIKKWQEGYHVVYGIRRNRKESWLKKLCYAAFYRLQQKVSFMAIPLDAGDFCLMDRSVVEELKKFDEDRPFVRGLRKWVGFKQIGIEYERHSRITGSPKYNIRKLFGLALDGIFSFSYFALRLSIWLGLFISVLSISYGIFIAVMRILIIFGAISSEKVLPGWTTLVVALLFLMGLQFIFLGILGEYVGRTFIQVKQRPLFVVEEELGLDNE